MAITRPDTTDIDRGNGNSIDGYYADEADTFMDAQQQQIAILEAELATLKARESPEDAWWRGAWHGYFSKSVEDVKPYIAPTAEEESKP